MTPLARRVLTATIAIPIVLVLVFSAPGDLAFAAFLAIFFMAAVEVLPMVRSVAPSVPARSLLALFPLLSIAGFFMLRGGDRDVSIWWVLNALGLLVVVAACTTLLARTDVRDGMATMGWLAFTIPYFAIPPLGLYWLKTIDPWLVMCLLGIIWMGDTGAFVVGNAMGRRKLAPSYSPAKSWEGAIGGFVAALLVTALWSLLRLGQLRLDLLAVAALTAMIAQLGDLVESVIKRGAGVKDSSNLLPGHGGFFDRMDSTLLATPVFVIGLQVVGVESLIPR